MTDWPKSPIDKFKKLARELEANEDEAHWDERLKKVAKQKAGPGEAGVIENFVQCELHGRRPRIGLAST